jgi:hypothetical protein
MYPPFLFGAYPLQTYIGHVLISVNPFRDLGIYTDAVLESYRGRNRLEVCESSLGFTNLTDGPSCFCRSRIGILQYEEL